MNEGSIFSTFIVVFREALEAGLIIGIILTVLNRLGAKRYFSRVIISSGLAVFFSYLLGVWLAGLTEQAQEGWAPVIEGAISLLACAVLTYMFFWMERQARFIKSDIETKMESALSTKDYLAIVSLPFFAVLREGAETVLFLKAVALQNGGPVSWLGGILGCGLAVTLSLAIFAGGRKVPLKPLFRTTGILIILIAAGLLAYGIHELGEIGWVPEIVKHVYDINPFLNEKKGLGSFLKALFGYNGNPSLTEVIAYWGYLTVIFIAAKRICGERGANESPGGAMVK